MIQTFLIKIPVLMLLNIVHIGICFAETKVFSWRDLNFVPCDGIGLTGSGEINLYIDYVVKGDTLTVKQMSVTGTYQHTIEISGALRFMKPDGSESRVLLQKPWFSEISADPEKTKSLHLPRKGSGTLPTDQVSLEARAGSNLNLSVGVLFPQAGGNCAATFDQAFKIP